MARAHPHWERVSDIYIRGSLYSGERGRCDFCGSGLDYNSARSDKHFKRKSVILLRCEFNPDGDWFGSCNHSWCADCCFLCHWCHTIVCENCVQEEHYCEQMKRYEAVMNIVAADIPSAVSTAPIVQSFFRHRSFERNLINEILKFL